MIYTMFAMVLLTFAVAVYMFRLRVTAVRSGQLKLSHFRLNNESDIPTKLTQASRNYSNLFEMPVLFYVAGSLAIALHLENTFITSLSWIFVASRMIHSYIHLTYNNVIHRLQAFMLGNICILLIWGIIVLHYTTNQI